VEATDFGIEMTMPVPVTNPIRASETGALTTQVSRCGPVGGPGQPRENGCVEKTDGDRKIRTAVVL